MQKWSESGQATVWSYRIRRCVRANQHLETHWQKTHGTFIRQSTGHPLKPRHEASIIFCVWVFWSYWPSVTIFSTWQANNATSLGNEDWLRRQDRPRHYTWQECLSQKTQGHKNYRNYEAHEPQGTDRLARLLRIKWRCVRCTFISFWVKGLTAPYKLITTPRLELLSNVILTRLEQYVSRA